MKLYERYGITDDYLDCLINRLIKKHTSGHINESQESKSIDAAKKLYMKRKMATRDEARDFITKLVNDIPFLRKQAGKFTLGVARMYLDGELNNASIINQLNTTLSFVATDSHINEYDRDLNGLSAVDLIDRFSGVISANVEAEKEDIAKMDFSAKCRYDIIKIDSFEKSKEFYKYTYPESRWCITWSEENYNKYTSNGMNQVYFCLRDDVDDVKPIPSENCPLDDYGLSMISVIVDSDGNLLYCTPRWNHNNGGNDNIMGAKDISRVVGVDFYKTFLPNNKWKSILADAKNKLDNGVSPEKVFKHVYETIFDMPIVVLSGRFNILTKDNEFLCDRWYNDINFKVDGFIVNYNNMFNILDMKTGKPKLKKWYERIESYRYGYATVVSKRKYNILDVDKETVILKDWYDNISNVTPKNAKVCLNKKWNIIDIKTGKMLLSQWVDKVLYTENSLIRLKDDNKNNIADSSGKPMFKKWADYILFYGDFIVLNYIVDNKDKWYICNKDGSPVIDKAFDSVRKHSNGLIHIKYKGKENLMNSNGKLVFNEWVDSVLDCGKSFSLAMVEDPIRFNFVYKDGRKLFNDWYPVDMDRFDKTGFIYFKFKGKKYKMNRDCEISRDE